MLPCFIHSLISPDKTSTSPWYDQIRTKVEEAILGRSPESVMLLAKGICEKKLLTNTNEDTRIQMVNLIAKNAQGTHYIKKRETIKPLRLQPKENVVGATPLLQRLLTLQH